MTHRTAVYIAAPYGPVGDLPDAEAEIRRNVARALALGRLAVVKNRAPIVPHAIGFMGTYGSPNESDDGTSRRHAVECGEALAADVGRLEGELWLLVRNDWSTSHGCALERVAFLTASARPSWLAQRSVTTATWAGWGSIFRSAGLAVLYDDPVAAFGLEL